MPVRPEAVAEMTRVLTELPGNPSGAHAAARARSWTTASTDTPQPRTPSSVLRVGFIGTLAPHKGPHLLLEA